MPCRGTGAVLSYLGGSPNAEPCPWCGGTGIRQAGIDAQARWRVAVDGEEAAASPAEPAA